MNLGLPELIVIFFVVLLFFGPKRLPELAKGIGKGIRDFKKSMSGEDEETQKLKRSSDSKDENLEEPPKR